MTNRLSKWLELRPLSLLTAIVLLVCVALMFFTDRPLALLVDRTVSASAVQFWRGVSRIGEAGIYLIFFLLLYLGNRALFLWTAPLAIARWYAHLARIGLFGLASYALSGGIVQSLKYLSGRYRPKHLIQDGDYGFTPFHSEWSFNSFPSGHSQSAFAVACVLSFVFPRATWFFLSIATAVAASRVLSGAHFLSDILFGSYVGIVCVLLIRRHWFSDVGTVPLSPAPYAK